MRDPRPTTVLMQRGGVLQRNEGETAESERVPPKSGLFFVVTNLEFSSHHLNRPAGRGEDGRRSDAMIACLSKFTDL